MNYLFRPLFHGAGSSAESAFYIVAFMMSIMIFVTLALMNEDKNKAPILDPDEASYLPADQKGKRQP